MVIKCDKNDLIVDGDSIYYAPGKKLIELQYVKRVEVIPPQKYVHGMIIIYYFDVLLAESKQYRFSFTGIQNFKDSCRLKRIIKRKGYDLDSELQAIADFLIDEEFIESLDLNLNDDDTPNLDVNEDNIEVVMLEENTDIEIVCIHHKIKLKNNFIYIYPGNIHFHINMIGSCNVEAPSLFQQGLICIILKDECSVYPKGYLFLLDDFNSYFDAYYLEYYVEHMEEIDDEIELYKEIHFLDYDCDDLDSLEESDNSLEEINKLLSELNTILERDLYWQEHTVPFSDFIDCEQFDNEDDYFSNLEELKKLNYHRRIDYFNSI